MQDTAEVPLPGEKRKDPEEAPLESPTKKKKQKATRLPLKTALTDDDYEQIAARLKDEMDDTFQAMQASQGKMQGVIDQQLVESKTLTEKNAMIHTQLIKTPAGESSTQSISCEEILEKDRINTVLIPPGSI